MEEGKMKKIKYFLIHNIRTISLLAIIASPGMGILLGLAILGGVK
jgi:hypothetical protein